MVSFDRAKEKQIQPCILLENSLYESNLMYVVAEGSLVCEIRSRKIADALVILLATYYMYNLDQNVGKNVYCFLDMALMGIVPSKCPASVKSLIGVLSNV